MVYSNFIFIEIDPSLKSDLYEALREEDITLKEWFLRRAGSYLAQRAQPSLFNSDQVAEGKVKAGKKER